MISSSRAVLFAFLAVVGSGCVHVQEVSSHNDIPLATKRLPPIPVEPEMRVSHRIEGSSLLVSVARQPRCQVEELQEIDRTEVIERRAAPGSLQYLFYEYGFAAVLGGAGAYFLATASSCEQKEEKQSDGSTKTSGMSPDVCRGVGYGMIGTAGLALGLGIWESLKLRNSEKHVGKMEVPRGKTVVDCGNLEPAAGVPVVIDIGGSQSFKQATSGKGEVLFVWPATQELSLKAQPTEAKLSVGTRHFIVDMTKVIPREVIESQKAKIALQQQREEQDARLRKAAACTVLCQEFEGCLSAAGESGRSTFMGICVNQVSARANAAGLSLERWQGIGEFTCRQDCARLRAQLSTQQEPSVGRQPKLSKEASELVLRATDLAQKGLPLAKTDRDKLAVLRKTFPLIQRAKLLECSTSSTSEQCLELSNALLNLKQRISLFEGR